MDTITMTRERINAEEPHDRKRIPRAMGTRILYACIPAPICRDPKSHNLTPLQVATMGTLLSLARIVNAAQHFTTAFDNGQSSIQLEGELHEQWRGKWREVERARNRGQHPKAPIRRHAHAWKGTFKPMSIKRAMQLAGSQAFRDKLKELRSEDIADVTFDVTRSALVQYVGLKKSGLNLKAVDDALTTLTDLINIGNRLRLPLVKVIRRATTMTITVSAAWANEQYHAVPLPLPTRSTLACRLLLWTHFIGGVKDESHTHADRSYEKFVEEFGYHSQRRANEAVNRAIDYLNKQYYPKLNKKALRPFGIKPPDAIEIIEAEGRIKIVGLTAGTYKFDKLMKPPPRPKPAPELELETDNAEARIKSELWQSFSSRLEMGGFD
jgi:hypothetical protein